MPELDRDMDIWPKGESAKPEKLLDFAAKLVGEAADEIKSPRELRGLADAVESCAAPGAVLQSFDKIPYRPLTWLWEKRFPLGKLTLLIGNPGLGKSIMLADLAGRVSVGAPWPDEARCETGSAIILSAEDDASDTIRPRLEVAGANLSKIHLLKAVRREMRDGKTSVESFCFEQDISAMRDAILSIGDTRLVAVDPISAYLGRRNSWRDSEMRALLSPLAEMAAETEVAVVAVTHLTKAGGTSAIFRSLGSIAFVAAARSVWFIGSDPEDPQGRVFLPVKANLSPASTGLTFRLEDCGNAARIAWGERTTITAESVLAAEQPSQVESAATWLKMQLNAGPLDSAELQRRAQAAQFSWASIRRAKDAVRVICRKSRGKQGGWTWTLPASTLPTLNTLNRLSKLSDLPKDAQGAQDVQLSQEDHLAQDNHHGERASEHARQPDLSRPVRKEKTPRTDAPRRTRQDSTLLAPARKTVRKPLIPQRGASA